jgi:tRNA-splicing ligase RtcB
MGYAMKFAEHNRQRMLDQVAAALDTDVRVVVDTHHNYAAWESHGKKNGIVHRKGSVRARAGEQVLIPGSMGTVSYWAEGLGNPASFESCQHGAGRAMSRGAAKRAFGVQQVHDELASVGTRVFTPDDRAIIEEAPGAYKDVDTVMEASADLVRVVKRLRPIATVKG